MSKKIILLFAIIASLSFAFAINNGDASAACNDGNGHFYTSGSYPYDSFSQLGGTEWSIDFACSGHSYGIMFITGASGVWYNGGNYYFDVNNWVSDYETTLYMMGMIHTSTGTKYAYSVGVCDGANSYICLNARHANAGVHVNNNAITSVCGSFIRATGASSDWIGGWTDPTESQKCAIQFNIEGLAKSLADGSIQKADVYTWTSGGTTYEIGKAIIYNQRCQTGNDSSCGGNSMYFLYDTAIGDPKDTTFTGDIDTYVGGSRYDNGATIPVTDARTAVTFRDKVTRNGGGSYTQRACYSGWGASGTRYSNHCHDFAPGTGDNVDKTTYVNLPRGSSATVCHTLYYPTKAKQDNTGSDYTTVTECVTLTRGGSDDNDCVPQMDSSFRKTDYVGKTDAWLLFRKNGTTTTLKGDSTTSHTYWAKPGDNIQYEYKLCGGSEYSRTADNDEPARGFSGANVQPKFDVSAKKDNVNNTSYLFGLSKTQYTSGSDLKYYSGFSSPTSNNYTCFYSGGATSQTNYYQIPAESGASSSCKSSSTAQYSDVGHTFRQDVSYQRVTTQRYDVYHPRTCYDDDGPYDCSYYTYGTELASGSSKTLTGEVKIPYNYALIGMSTHSLTKGIIYAGTSFSASGQVKVLSRSNNEVNGSTAYATRTKTTTIKMVSFTTDGRPSGSGNVYTGASASLSDICYRANANSASYSNCTETSTSFSGFLNDGNSQLAGGDTKNVSSSFSVPSNVVPGTRVCTAIAYWPVDSHDTGNNSAITGTSQDAAFRATGNRWAVSAPACVTVAKKPTFSVESSQAVTSGTVTTSVTTVNNRIYGSWSEYGIIAGGKVSNMASGAAVGYQSQVFNTDLRKNVNAGVALANSGAPSAKYNPNGTGCYISPQTMMNNNCTNLGGATRIISNYKGNEVAKKLADMYLMSDAKMATYGAESGMKGINRYTTSVNGANPKITIGGKTYYNYYDRGDAACRYNASTGKYYAPAYTSSSYVKDNTGTHAPVFCTENGVKYYKVNGNVWMHGSGIGSNMQVGGAGTSDLGAGGSSVSYRNVTYVFDFRGTAIIDENFIINNAGHGDVFNTLDQLPTVLIFADDAIITDNVTRLDAWIILGAQHDMSSLNGDEVLTGSQYDGSGELNTCGAKATTSSVSLISSYDSDTCNKQLLINSPIYAKKLTLRRNFGSQYDNSRGGIGDNGYIQRGEIFNMRPDIYYWTYYQAQRNSILTTVFSRELPVRY